MSQFRELVIESACRIKLRNNNLLIETTDGTQELPLEQTNSIVIDTKQCIITVSALVAIQQFHVNLVLEDKHYQPVAFQQPDRVAEQFHWDNNLRANLWQMIVRAKMTNQVSLAKLTDYFIPAKITDSDEAQLAKLYFHHLFGTDFRRDFSTGTVNVALNYGYSILTSKVAVNIVAHGYSNVLGIHHHSDDNSLNLACDFVEPWRLIIDQYVVKHQKDQFDSLYRQNLVDLLNLPVVYQGKQYQTVVNAIQQYVDDCFAYLIDDLSVSRIEVKLCDHALINHV